MTSPAQPNAAHFEIQRIFVRSLTFDVPVTEHAAGEEWKPEVALHIDTKSTLVQDDVHEVELLARVTVSSNQKTAFTVEVRQAGRFKVNGFTEDQLEQVLGSACLTILFPYVREAISDVVTRGGFPQLLLAPINFDAVYAQRKAQQVAEASSQVIH